MALKTKFNYSKLRGRIRELFGSEAEFAKALGCSTSTISLKLNNLGEFTQSEIFNAVRILKLQYEEISVYFFTVEV